MSDGGTVKKTVYSYTINDDMINNSILKNTSKHPVNSFQTINRQVSGESYANEKHQINEFDKTIKYI